MARFAASQRLRPCSSLRYAFRANTLGAGLRPRPYARYALFAPGYVFAATQGRKDIRQAALRAFLGEFGSPGTVSCSLDNLFIFMLTLENTR